MPLTKELPFRDVRGTEIKEFAVLKMYHFTGTRGKKHYMYKWVRLKIHNRQLRWVAFHLTNGHGEYILLQWKADKERVIRGAEIVQQY